MQLRDSKFPHIKWMDLNDDGVMVEVAVMKVDKSNGDIAFFKVNNLDDIDKRRLFDIVSDPKATMFELWDLMKQRTLKNGENALKYFHQLVKTKTRSGQIIDINAGARGAIQAPTVAPAAKVGGKGGRGGKAK